MDAWFQRADFSGPNFEFYNADDAVKYWQNIDAAKEDELIKNAGDDGEWCPWGLGIGFETGIWSIHIYRDDIDSNTIAILIERNIPAKLLGIIPYNKTEIKFHEGLPYGKAEDFLRMYFDQDEKIFY